MEKNLQNIERNLDTGIDYNKIAECLKYKAMAVHCAHSTYHPAYQKYIEVWNTLSVSETLALCAISPLNNESILN